MKNIFKSFVFLLVVLGFILIGTTCTIGLGASVDTEAPTIEITYPPISATIRDTFTLYGTWNDDQGVTSVRVSVINAKTKETVLKEASATVDSKNKTWQLELDSTDFSDGNYQITAYAMDGASHKSGDSNRSFDIDNTPPVFIISNPGVIKSSGKEASAYGSTLSIEGTIADEHTIPKMQLSVYKEDGTLIETFEESDISTAGGTSVTFANSYKGSNDNYYKMYTEEGDETQNFYCTVELYDSSYIYTSPSTGAATTSIGNSTSQLYLYDDIFTELLSNNGGLGLDAAALMNVINGNSSLETSVQTTVKNLLAKKVIDSSISNDYLAFSLNPNANPTYTVNGYDVDISNENWTSTQNIHQLSGGGTISVSYSYGLNETLIQPYGDSEKGTPSLKVWMKKIGSDTTEETALSDLTDLQAAVKILENNSTTFTQGTTTADSDWLLIYDYAQQNSQSSSSATGTISVTIPSGKIDGGAYYLFGVTGCDLDNMYFSQKATYLFQGTINGYAPTVKITTPESNSTYTNVAGMTFKGSATLSEDENLYVKEIEATFKYGVTSTQLTTYNLKYRIEKVTENNSDTFTVLKVSKDSEGNETTETLTGTEPLTFYPTTIYETDENGNKKENILHSAGDFAFDVSKFDNYSALKTELDSGKEYTYSLSITATSSSEQSATDVRNIYVDTVKPTFDDEKSSVGDITTVESVNSTWFNSENLSVKGYLNDAGSGVSSVYYWLDSSETTIDVKNENYKGTLVPQYDKDSKYKYTSTIDGFSEQTEAHTLVLIGIDKAGNESTQKSYSVKVDTTYPKITPKYYTMGRDLNGDASGNVLTNKENDVVVYGLVSDTASGVGSVKITNSSGSEIATVTYSTAATTVTTSEGESAVTTDIDTNLTWFESQTFADYDSSLATSYTAWKAIIAKENISDGDVKYIATDTAGNSITNRMFTFTVDTTKPTVSYNDLTDADSDTDGTQVNGKITLSGRASDSQMNSITKIQYRIGDDGIWTTISDGINTSLTNAYNFTSNEIDTSTLFPESKTVAETVYFRAIALDAAGNYSDESDSGIKVIVEQNSDRPIIRIATLDESGAIISSTTVMGTISDDDGISKFEYSTDGGTSWNNITVSSGSWKIENLDAGTYSLTFRVTDKAGTVFTTNQTTGTFATYDRPYLMLAKDTEKKDNTSALTFSVDLNAPEIKTLKLAATSDTTALTANSTSWSENSVNFGADAKYLWIYVEANEDVAVHKSAKDDISVKIGQTSIDFAADDFKNVIFSRTPEGRMNGDLIYIVGPIDISNITGAEGTQTVSVTVKDESTSESSATQNIYIDEGAPEVSITSPNATQAEAAEKATNGVSTTIEAITGKYTIKGRVADTSGIAKFEYLIPTQQQITDGITSSMFETSVNSLSGTAIDENETKLTSSNWKIDFTTSGFETETDATHGTSLIYYATAKSDGKLIYATEVSTGSTTGEVYVPLYFYVEDATGNGEIVENKILVNPQGGIPTIEIITPDNLAKTGGNLNFQGTASDDEKVSKVVLTKLQFSATEATDQSSADAISDWQDVTAEILETEGVVTKGTVVSDDSTVTITADGTNSWKIAINTSKISDDSITSLLGTGNELKTVRATIVSYDENGTPSNYDISTLSNSDISSDSDENETSYVQRTIFVDKNAPKLGTTQLVQFDSTPTSATETPSVIRTYTAGMYISGKVSTAKWYLKGVVTDDASVTGISITTSSKDYIQLEDKVGTDTIGDTPATPKSIIYSGLNTKTFTFLIPINTDKEGQFYPTIEMWDGQHTDVTSNVSFFVDNDAPSLYTTSDEKTATLAHANTLRLVSNGLNISTTNVVENSDGAYSFGDTVEESKSGLDFIAIYFKKAANTKFNTANRVYSPLFSTDNVVTLTEVLTGSTVTDGQVYINSEYLPALVKTVTRSDATHISYDGLGSNGFIKPYTVVKMAGSYVRITGIDGNVATLASEVPTDVTECEFIYAQIVDHAVSEGFASDGTISNDDGDGFVETLKQTGSSYKWSASVYSDNIPDGPAEIHVVAFDAAGNFNAGYVETSIQNNRPRISKVLLATDLDGNGTFDFYNSDSSILNDLSDDDTVQNGSQFGEYVFYSTLKVTDSDAKGVAQAKVTLTAPKVFNVKKDLLVLPEFVGGNGALKYAYSLDNSDAVSAPVTASGNSLYSLANTVDDLKLANKTGTSQNASSLVQTGVNASNYGGVVLTMNADDENIKALDDGNVKYLAFTFWDNTSETTQGTDSLWAMVNIPVYVDVYDDEKPKSTITPFWWESADDYKSSFVYDSEGNAQGHISNITDSDRENGTKPGVSGKVYINGTSYDETRLGEIHVVKPDSTDVKIIYKDDNNNWAAVDGAEIIEEDEPSQDGHTITWRYQIDMTSYGVATDKVVKTYAVDAQTNTEDVSSVSTQTTTKTKTPYYKMDFVPYIKSIYTTSIGSANRSRLGKFPVRAGKEMTIEGMNFASGATYTVKFYKSGATAGTVGTEVTDEAKTGTISTKGSITVTAPEYSRWVEVVVDGVATPNNNTTDVSEILGYDIESGYVSGSYRLDETKYTDNGLAKSNKNGTDFWTNNRYIAVWNVPSTSLFVGSINPHSGVIKKISEKNSGSATDNQTTNDSVGGGAFYNQNGQNSALRMSSKQDGKYFGAISSDDLKIYGYLSSVSYSNHGDNVSTSKSEAMFQAPGVDELDYVIVNGMPYYVMQDNFVGGDSASVFGPGLFITKEGMQFDMAEFQKGNTIEERDTFAIVERQGSSGAAANRSSSTGYDSVMYQFKNPRIVGWHSSTDTMIYSTANQGQTVTGVDYIYVSYYDSYARCLKYGAFKVGHRINKNSLIELYKWGNVAEYCDIVPAMKSSPNNTGCANNVVAANHMTDGATVVAGKDTTTTNPTDFDEEAGEWSDIMVDSTSGTPIPVIIYYSKSNKRLEIARGTASFPTSLTSTSRTVKDVAEYYGISAAEEEQPSEWVTSGNISKLTLTSTNKYLWNYEVATNDDNTTTISTPHIICTYSGTGSIAVSSYCTITEYYATSLSNTVESSAWSTTFKAPTSEASNLFNYEKVTVSSTDTSVDARAIGSYSESRGKWEKSTIKPSGTSDFGRYVSAAMDEAGNIHAAAVDAGKGKVYYLYLTRSGNTYSVANSAIIGDVNACWTDIELTNGGITTQATTAGSTTATKDVKPVISWVDKSELNATDGVKVSYLADDDTDGTKWETMTDPAVYAVNDQRTSVMADVYEGSDSKKAKVGVGFNSDMLALDFLRGEE